MNKPAHKSIADRKKEIIADLKSARSSVIEAIAALPAGRQDVIFLGEWSIKDLIAHLIGWDMTNRRAVQEILTGQAPTFFQYYDKNWQSYNRSLVAKYKLESLSALLAAAETSHRELVTFVESLSAEDLVNGKARNSKGRSITICNLLRAEARDESVHAEQVRMWLA